MESNLTQSQLMFWTGQELSPGVPLYNVAMIFELGGPIDPKHFGLAFQGLIDRCDPMRTVFKSIEGIPNQQVLSDMPYELELLDRSHHSEADTEKWLLERCQQPLDLSKCPCDSVLIQVATDRYIWYLNQHHIITDAWGISVQYDMMAKLYQLSTSSKMEGASPLPAFKDYVNFERPSIGRDEETTVNSYWREKAKQLAVPPRLYGSSGQITNTSSKRVSIELGIQRSNKLRSLTKETDIRAWTQDLSLYNVFATVLFAYLYRISGQSNIAIGTPAHNRPTAAFKETPGLFIEMFPLLLQIEKDDTFKALFQRLRIEVNGFLKHAQPGTTSATLNRGFNVVLNYLHASFSDFNELPSKTAWLHPDHADAHHHLRLQVLDFDTTGNIQIHFDCNTTVFSEKLRNAVPSHFLALLDAFIEDRSQRITNVELLTEDELQRVQQNQQKTVADQGPEETVVELFAAQVAQSRGATAITYKEQSLSYETLAEKSNQLAHFLQQQGIGPGKNVALYLKRSPELLISIWGVLKAGATYIPIASNSPKERVAYMVEDSNASLLLTTEKLKASYSELRAFCVDSDWTQVESMPKDPPNVSIKHDSLAYIMYTSGSTGRPKGVRISHRALGNYISWAKGEYVKSKPPVFPLFTMTSFDLTVTSLFVPLVAGGSLVIFEEEDFGPDLAVLKVFNNDLVNTVKLTPSHLALLRDRDLSGSGIECLIVGGEDFKMQLAKELHTAFNHKVRIYNEYGPTEATVGSVVYQLGNNDNPQSASVPIGTPITNMQAYVLDDALHPVPPGVTGELYLSGTGLAAGYLNQPDLSNEKFIENPFDPGEKLYRTGDLARLNEQDNLEYLGRQDEQVKIGGIRVELGEIETALSSYPSVTDCVVDLQGNKNLVPETEVINCAKCGLPSNYPSVEFDEHDVCELCRSFENYQQKAHKYFRNQEELRAIFEQAQARKSGPYDCLSLLSGGKDSTYALAQLVEMGFKVLAFTLDNGYISEQAKDNIRRVVKELGVDHVFGETEAMNAIFVDSLQRHCNVCNGCFKTIYTLSTKLAVDKGIPIIVTGLSRGQFFETRLTEELFRNENVDFDGIDETILEARKAYHRTDDAVNQLLDVSIFKDDKVFEQVQFVDYYRYSDVSLDGMLAYLDARVPWVRPTDTGRSTNCLINQVGIYVHKKERGYSNYAFPYSWDVRVGHKNRDASLEEINEEIDEKEVHRIMNEIGYQQMEGNAQQLVAYYVGDSIISQTELRQHLAQQLPAYMMPTQFQKIDEIPLTSNGKVDRKSLPGWDAGRPDIDKKFEGPESQIEHMLAEIWSKVLQIPRISVHDNFLQLGGNSLAAIRLMARINETFELELPLSRVFEYPTIAEFGKLIEETIEALLGEIEDED